MRGISTLVMVTVPVNVGAGASWEFLPRGGASWKGKNVTTPLSEELGPGVMDRGGRDVTI